MQERKELDWVGYVLRDVVTFLAENDMMLSAQMLAVAAAHIDHDLRRQTPAPQAVRVAETNVITFPIVKRMLS
jgi:hypothetical protein